VRNLNLLDIYRRTDKKTIDHFGSAGDEENGAFEVPSPVTKAPMFIIASSGMGWDHVSVSLQNRCPNWPEMEHVKRIFFRDDEVAMQLHVPIEDHISFSETCLHLWRPLDIEIPRPPSIFVGPKA